MKLRYYILFSVLIAAWGVKAQQDPQYTQYMFNGLALNPAYAGSHDALSLTALYRNQWVDIPGAPTTMTFSAHTPFISQRVGIGLQVVNDKIGINNQTNIMGSYSYWIPVSENGGRLAFGLQGGVTTFQADNSVLNLENPDEDNFAGNFSELKPNVGGGLYYYTDRMFVGVSVPQLMETTFGAKGSDIKKKRHFFTYVGYVVDLNANWKFKPTVLLKSVPGAPLEMDFSANFLFIEKVWIGLGYRSFDSFNFLTQYFITEQLSAGYAYDYTLTTLGNYNSGSHELMVNYLFKFDDKKMLTPRYF